MTNNEQWAGLSLAGPWSYAFLKGGKLVENRTWRPPAYMKGIWIALHASKSYDESDQAFIAEVMNIRVNDVPTRRDYQHSVVFGVAQWNGVIIKDDPKEERELMSTGMPMPADQERWFFGPYGWLLENFTPLPTPVPTMGALGLWRFHEKPQILAAIKEQLANLKSGSSQSGLPDRKVVSVGDNLCLPDM